MHPAPLIDVYTICWNEQRMLPYFLRHYGQFARRIVVSDDGSTDSTVQIARSHPLTEVRPSGLAREFDGEAERLALREQQWRESRGRADWVVVVDCDEFLWHPDLVDYLRDCRRRGVTVPRTLGYEMVANHFPSTGAQIYDEIRNGVRANHMDKLVIFDPGAVDSMNYAVGRHHAQPAGRIAFDSDPGLLLLHYKHLGAKYVLPRYRELEGRRTVEDRWMGWSAHYEWPDQLLLDWHRTAMQNAVDVLAPWTRMSSNG